MLHAGRLDVKRCHGKPERVVQVFPVQARRTDGEEPSLMPAPAGVAQTGEPDMSERTVLPWPRENRERHSSPATIRPKESEWQWRHGQRPDPRAPPGRVSRPRDRKADLARRTLSYTSALVPRTRAEGYSGGGRLWCGTAGLKGGKAER